MASTRPSARVGRSMRTRRRRLGPASRREPAPDIRHCRRRRPCVDIGTKRVRARGAVVKLESVGVVGGGAWGTALAQTMRLAGHDVLLWAREAEVVAEVNARHTNSAFLPGLA